MVKRRGRPQAKPMTKATSMRLLKITFNRDLLLPGSMIKECMEPGNNKSLLKVIFSRRMLVAFVMGFACGLPLLLTITVLQAWMKEEGAADRDRHDGLGGGAVIRHLIRTS